MIHNLNLKVFVYEPDIFARYAINSYLAWDRRTRVMSMFEHVEDMFDWLARHAEVEWPNFVIIGTLHYSTPDTLAELITRLTDMIQDVSVLVLSHDASPEMALAAHEAGARGFFFRNDVSIQVAWAIVWAQEQTFAVSQTVSANIDLEDMPELADATLLPSRRQYPELTDRIREAIQLCVVEGMSADLAADEMGVSIHTIRSYVKEGYRILESYDPDREYPAGMSAQERAFMRFTALADDSTAQLEIEEIDVSTDEE